MLKKEILVVNNQSENAKFIAGVLQGQGYKADVAEDSSKARGFLDKKKYLLVLADLELPLESAPKLLEYCANTLSDPPPFVFITATHDPAVIAEASKLGAVDVIEKPLKAEDIIAAVHFMEQRGSDKLLDLMGMISRISGINLGPEKRFLVETRLLRRTRQLSLPNLDAYLKYFQKHRKKEVEQLISLITTHTTEFFRDHQHFDFLMEHAYKKLLNKTSQKIKVWSAASSTGEELYSAAICWSEFARQAGRSVSEDLFVGLGTDIDKNSLETATNGVYPKGSVKKLSDEIVKRYFHTGKGSLAQYVRVNDRIHSKCRFTHYNLISPHGINEKFDLIFLRNVLIYFKTDKVEKIVANIKNHLNVGGYLFLGYSESLNGIEHGFESAGHAIFQKTARTALVRSVPKETTTFTNVTVEKDSSSKIRVFIIDDSATIRLILKRIFSEDPRFEVVGEAVHPKAMKGPLRKEDVDVVTLDLHMPEQDGISYLRSIDLENHPAVVIFSSLTEKDGIDVMNCLELGAKDYIEKPSMGNLDQVKEQIKDTLVAAARKKLASKKLKINRTLLPTYTYDPNDLFLIGASTGGVEAIKTVLMGFPEQCPPVLMVQHIPATFSKTFAQRLAQMCPIKVTEAIDGEEIEPNHAYVAPGGRQMGIIRSGKKLTIKITDDPPMNRHKPSVDYLFNSVAQQCKSMKIVASILTGMGEDGARGMVKLREKGVFTIGQDEESSVVYGMPKAAFDMGGVMDVVSLESVAHHMFSGLKKLRKVA